MKQVKCEECGKKFKPGQRPDGLPTGIGFQMRDGSIYNVCSDCLIDMGRKKEYAKNKK